MGAMLPKKQPIGAILRSSWKATFEIKQRIPTPLRSFEQLRRLVVNLLVTFIVIAISYIIIVATLDETTVIEPLSVPKSLAESGFTGNVIAQTIVDKIVNIGKEAATLKTKGAFGEQGKFAEASTISIPASSLSIGNFVGLLRSSLPFDYRRVSGDITLPEALNGRPAGPFHLTLRYFKNDGREVREIIAASLDDLSQQAAEAVVEKFDGYVLATYLYNKSGGGRGRSESYPRLDELVASLITANDPKTLPWAMNIQGMISLRTGALDKAAAQFKRLVELTPDFAPAYANWGLVLNDKGDRDGAIVQFRKAVELNPKAVGAYSSWCAALISNRDFDGAIDKCSKAVEIDPKFANAYLSWGNALLEKGDIPGAVAKYQKTLEIDSKYANAYLNWGGALSRKGDIDGAIEKYRKVVAMEPKYTIAYLDWGSALAKKGDTNGAIEKYRNAVELDPRSTNAYLLWGNVLSEKGDLDGAIEKYDRAIQLDPTYSIAFNNRCYLRARLNLLQLALADCDEALRLLPDSDDYFDSRGYTHLKLGMFALAIFDYENALKINPRNATALFGRGVARRQEGKASSGDADIASAKAIRPGIVREMADLGVRP